MKRFFTMLVMMTLGVIGFAQTTVSGVITDDTGEPLIGANVVAEGTTVGTITDFDGNYSLEVPEGVDALVITYTGYSTQTVDINGRSSIDVTLQEGVLLGDVVVTALGIAKDSRKLGYAVESVSSEELANSGENNVMNALNAKAAGVQITSSSGSPGSSTNVRIRGNTSILGSNSPLFVIDGIPIDNSNSNPGGVNAVDGVDNSSRVADINPNDIEDISILKGAAATAVYGIRAANGVILITTKKGKSGKPRITFNSRFQLDEVNKLPDLQTRYAQGVVVDGVPTYRGPETFAGESWGPEISSLEYDGSTDYFFDQKGRLVPRGQGNGTPAQAYDPYDFFVTGSTYDVNIGVSGGTDKVTYYISGGRLESKGVAPNSDWSRNSFRLNTEFKASDKLSFNAAANYTQTGGNRLQRGSNLRGIMLGLLRNTPTFDIGNGKVGQDAADDGSVYQNPDGTQRSYRWGIYDNPYWVVNKNATQDNVNRIIGSVGLKYDIVKNLSFNYKLGVDNYSDTRLGHIDLVPDPFGTNWDDGSVQNYDIQSTDLNSDFFINYGVGLTQKIHLDITAGHNYLKQRFTERVTDGNVLNIPGFYHITNATNVVSDENYSNRDLVGVFGVVDLNINEMLFLNGTIRNDWSSTLAGTDNPSFTSYSANVGFAFSELLPSASWFDYGKLRLSYGSNGNDAPVFATNAVLIPAVIGGDGFLTNNQFPFSGAGVNSFELDNTLANNQLKPERTTTYEIGLQMDFFRGRLGFDVTYYDSESEDVIIPVDVSPASGGTNLFLNTAVISNKGWEALLKIVPISNTNFKWVSDFNFTAYENEVLDLAEGVETYLMAGFTSTSSRAVVGQPYGAIYGTGYQRDDQGRLVIDANGFPAVDPVTKALGDPNPDFLLGWRNSFTVFKNFTLSGLLDIREGGDVWNGTQGIINFFGTSGISGDLRSQMVTFEGVNAAGEPVTSTVPYFDPAQGTNNGNFFRRYGFGGISEQGIQDASWVRLRELSLSYALPNKLLSNVGIASANVSLIGRNLWLSTDYTGIDPETNLTGAQNGIGLEYFNNPNTKSYAINLNVTF